MGRVAGRSSAALVVHDGLVCSQVRGDFRLAMLFEVSGRADHSARAQPDLSRRQCGVLERAHAQRDIYSGSDQIDVPVLENGADAERRVFSQKSGQSGHDMPPGKRYVSADPQLAAQTRAGTTGGYLSLVGFIDGALGALIEVLAGLGGRDASRGTSQQPHAESLLELRDGLGYGRLPDAKLIGSSRERAGLYHAHEGSHRSKADNLYAKSGQPRIVSRCDYFGTTGDLFKA